MDERPHGKGNGKPNSDRAAQRKHGPITHGPQDRQGRWNKLASRVAIIEYDMTCRWERPLFELLTLSELVDDDIALT